MVAVWFSPPSGNLLNNGQPWRRGDQASISLEISPDARNDLDRLELIGGQLPPGLFYNNGTLRILGTVRSLPKDQESYPVVFRVFLRSSNRTYDRSFRFIVDLSDEEQSWSSPSGIQDLGLVNRGSNVVIQLDIVNPDQDPLEFKAVGYKGPAGSQSGLPIGLEVDQFGRIVGSPTITGNVPGDYYFRVYARDPDDLQSNPRGEGSPRTSEKVYKLTIGQDIVLDARLSDVVRWETPAGSLGSTFETYPSHFGVRAVPQYQVASGNSTESQVINYTITPGSRPLPEGLLLDPSSGLIIGRCPYVTVTRTFDFIVEARVVFVNNETGEVRPSAIASERSFSITIRSIFAADSVTSLQFNVPGPARQKIAKWVWGTLPEPRPDYSVSQRVYIGNGTDSKFLVPRGRLGDAVDVFLNNQIYRGTISRITELREDFIIFPPGSIPAAGTEIKIIRYVNNAGALASDRLTVLGRDQLYREIDQYFGKNRQYRILLTNGINYQTGDLIDRLKDYHHPTKLRIGKVQTARARSPEGVHLYDVIYLGILDPMEGAGGFNTLGQEEPLNRYNPGQTPVAIPKWNLLEGTSNYYPNSIKNLRSDLINRNDRLPGALPGYGISGREGLPLWMISEQERGRPDTILGYQCAIELAHVRAGSGPAIVRALDTAGINDDLQGTTIEVDRYLLISDGFASTTFDGTEFGFPEITTFDGPDNLDTPTVAFTTFDTSLQSESKYYKFPPGDK
jgi:hypothetical protein